MDKHDDLFCRRLDEGPALLFLGQGTLGIESGKDSFLAEVLRKYHRTGISSVPTYDDLLANSSDSSPEQALAWMHQLCNRVAVPPWLGVVANYPWSGIFTSAIDAVWDRAFQSEHRELYKIFEERVRPLDPRNRMILHCTYLFGCVDRASPEDRPPLSALEKIQRRQVAIALARRLAEIITPFGILAIEGYRWDDDWLKAEDFYPILAALGKDQAHMFSVGKDSAIHPLAAELIRTGRLTLHTGSLAETLSAGSEAGILKLGLRSDMHSAGHSVALKDCTLNIPPVLWRRITKTAIVVDDALVGPAEPVSMERLYADFRTFLSESYARPIWSGYRHGFAFSRDFEEKLYERVTGLLAAKSISTDPVILHGQSGTGKTIALGALAARLRREKKCPVLFTERRAFRPSLSDMDAFCNWAEDNGADATLVIWDGMREPEDYTALLQYLASRGRRNVVVVGSCYPDHVASLKKNASFIEAPPGFSPGEQHRFLDFLSKLDPLVGQYMTNQQITDNTSFLVALYRLLPATRAQLTTGIRSEVDQAEQRIKKLAEHIRREPELGSLAYAFQQAGLSPEVSFLSEAAEDIAGEARNQVQMLIDLVMVPGKFGLFVPVELLFRSLGAGYSRGFLDVLSRTDIFRWDEDRVGNILIGPRQPLEAKLITQSRLGGAEGETEFACRLIGAVSASASGDNPEVQFVVDLIRNMGPNGQSPNYYRPHFKKLSDKLGELRSQHSVINPRLMLQEATLLREYVIKEQSTRQTTAAGTLLSKAEETLRTGIEYLTEHEPRNRLLHSMFLVELATTLGTLARQTVQESGDISAALGLYEEVQLIFQETWATNPDMFHIVDVMAWTSMDILKQRDLDSKIIAETSATILHVLTQADDGTLPTYDRERLGQRRMQIAGCLGDQKMSEEAFEALRQAGSTAGYYLRACQLAGEDTLRSQRLRSADIDTAQAALQFLHDSYAHIRSDGRCLYLMFRLWWMVHTGTQTFAMERQSVPLSAEDWRFCDELVESILALRDFQDDLKLKFFHGLAAYHLGAIDETLRVFGELEKSAEHLGRRRIVKSYVASNADGSPRTYTGHVKTIDRQGRRGMVYLPDIRREIPFYVRDFNLPEVKIGDPLPGFHVAFNFIGPIADPREAVSY